MYINQNLSSNSIKNTNVEDNDNKRQNNNNFSNELSQINNNLNKCINYTSQTQDIELQNLMNKFDKTTLINILLAYNKDKNIFSNIESDIKILKNNNNLNDNKEPEKINISNIINNNYITNNNISNISSICDSANSSLTNQFNKFNKQSNSSNYSCFKKFTPCIVNSYSNSTKDINYISSKISPSNISKTTNASNNYDSNCNNQITNNIINNNSYNEDSLPLSYYKNNLIKNLNNFQHIKQLQHSLQNSNILNDYSKNDIIINSTCTLENIKTKIDNTIYSDKRCLNEYLSNNSVVNMPNKYSTTNLFRNLNKNNSIGSTSLLNKKLKRSINWNKFSNSTQCNDIASNLSKDNKELDISSLSNIQIIENDNYIDSRNNSNNFRFINERNSTTTLLKEIIKHNKESKENSFNNDLNKKCNYLSPIENKKSIDDSNSSNKSLEFDIYNKETKNIKPEETDNSNIPKYIGRVCVSKPDCLRNRIRSNFMKYLYKKVRECINETNPSDLFYPLSSKIINCTKIKFNRNFLQLTVKEAFSVTTGNRKLDEKVYLNRETVSSFISKKFQKIVNTSVKQFYNIYINSNDFVLDIKLAKLKFGDEYALKLNEVGCNYIKYYLNEQ